MKKLLLAIVMMASISIANAQTKGTNTVGLGVNYQTQKSEANNQSSYTSTNRLFSLGYGRFINENERIGLDLSYGESELNVSSTIQVQKSYGGKLSYQKYYLLLKKFYAFGGGRAGYIYSDSDFNNSSSISGNSSNIYSLGGYGGVTWFLSKRFAFEADLLAADVNYSKTKNSNNDPNNTYKSTNTSFNLTTAGAINNLGFKIYLLF